MSLNNFAFVLFKPKSPGNIGAAARALKNMGFRDLRITNDAGLHPDSDAENEVNGRWHDISATKMAVHGRDILASATLHEDLASALADRTLVVGTTARGGLYRNEARSIREVSDELSSLSEANRIAFVFGPEDCGLTNEELKLCQRLVTIPTAPEYRSLNLAQAVLIVAYELMLAAGATRELRSVQSCAAVSEVEAMLARMGQALIEIGFLPEDNPDHIMFALRALLGRAGLQPRELDILNGVARQIRWFVEGGHETIAWKRRTGRKLK